MEEYVREKIKESDESLYLTDIDLILTLIEGEMEVADRKHANPSAWLVRLEALRDKMLHLREILIG